MSVDVSNHFLVHSWATSEVKWRKRKEIQSAQVSTSSATLCFSMPTEWVDLNGQCGTEKGEQKKTKKNSQKHNNEECWSSIRKNMIVSARTNQTQMIMVDGRNSQRK